MHLFHKWSEWKDVELEKYTHSVWKKGVKDSPRVTKQQRHCVICGRVQEKTIT